RLPLEVVAQYEAVRLFVERGQAVHAEFALTSDNAHVIVELCRRLDGLPLAIELAAARIKLLSPQSILARLADPFPFFTAGARDRPARQQTLRDAIAWTHELLNDSQRRLFRSLSVFRGGWTLEAAGAIFGQEVDVLDGLSSLLDWSLVRRMARENGQSRFSML